ncbi:hypothetical protein B296_00025334 [Ensete ventricosum]|uniref:Uncharacterized protein n=1 Tax=Ensete ventricosum TaxID=4639 RepID=A0A426XRD2_ENSVE|nr:hypothetical protein B296_00025334 [Ensete ventricosum]
MNDLNNERRSCKMPDSRKEEEEGPDSTQFKCLPRSIRVASFKQSKIETVRSPASGTRMLSWGFDITKSSPLCSSKDGSKKITDASSTKGSFAGFEYFREERKEKVIEPDETRVVNPIELSVTGPVRNEDISYSHAGSSCTHINPPNPTHLLFPIPKLIPPNPTALTMPRASPPPSHSHTRPPASGTLRSTRSVPTGHATCGPRPPRGGPAERAPPPAVAASPRPSAARGSPIGTSGSMASVSLAGSDASCRGRNTWVCCSMFEIEQQMCGGAATPSLPEPPMKRCKDSTRRASQTQLPSIQRLSVLFVRP